VQSSSQIVTTDKPSPNCCRGRMPFLSPNQHQQTTEGNKRQHLEKQTD